MQSALHPRCTADRRVSPCKRKLPHGLPLLLMTDEESYLSIRAGPSPVLEITSVSLPSNQRKAQAEVNKSLHHFRASGVFTSSEKLKNKPVY